MAADVTNPARSLPPVLTADGRAWLEARHERIGSRLARIDEELANERTQSLIDEHQQLVEQHEALSRVLRDAVAPRDVADDPSIVEVGDEVEVEFPDGTRETFLIVHPVEAGMDERRTSMDAPLAAAVLGSRPGDEVQVVSPAGVYRCTVLERTRIG